MLNTFSKSFKGSKISISGSGNVVIYAVAQKHMS